MNDQSTPVRKYAVFQVQKSIKINNSPQCNKDAPSLFYSVHWLLIRIGNKYQ